MSHSGNSQPSIDNEEHDHLPGGVAVKKVGLYSWNGTDWERQDANYGVSPLDAYALYATEYGATYNYICKEDKDGNWYIQRETISTGIRDYATGTTNVATAWTGRAGQTYALFSVKF